MPHPFNVDLTADGHVHTRLCGHADGAMKDYVEASLRAGLRKITFLEHLEVNIDNRRKSWLSTDDFAEYFRRGRRLQKEYRGRIDIRLGVEAGYNPQAIESLQQSLARYPWDTIGLSYHFYSLAGLHYNMAGRNRDHIAALKAQGRTRVAEDYFKGLIQALENISCDTICHLDAVMRHDPTFTFTGSHLLLIDTLLESMQAKGVALEINTAGFTIRDHPHPCPQITQKAILLSIPLVVGSDAHHPTQVGRFFDQLPNWFQSLRLRSESLLPTA
ncbi:MAG TPA: histidinol-phosphatase HisJ family protein [Desulfobulbaceae bacterium]|nr:histidinol-phosphatase HisJ family protein [Desulfobulbaceae bacterium]